jgi:hypothetical protein
MSEHTPTGAGPGAGDAGTKRAQFQEVVAADATIASLPHSKVERKLKLQPLSGWPDWLPDPRLEALSAVVMFWAPLSDCRDRLQTIRLRPNPAGGKRPWLAKMNGSVELALTREELWSVRRFAAAFDRNEWVWNIRRPDGIGHLALFHLPSQACWEKMIRNVVNNADKFAGGAE